jgi:hypothetical protein
MLAFRLDLDHFYVSESRLLNRTWKEKLPSTRSTRVWAGFKDYQDGLAARSRNTRHCHALKIATVDAYLAGEGSLHRMWGLLSEWYRSQPIMLQSEDARKTIADYRSFRQSSQTDYHYFGELYKRLMATSSNRL